MKVQLGSIGELDAIFQELLGGPTEGMHTAEELEVLQCIKKLFLRNTEIGGREMGLHDLCTDQQDANNKATLLLQVESAEKERMEKLKELCTLRKQLPLQLKQELEKECEDILGKLSNEESAVSGQSIEPEVEPLPEILAIRSTAADISEKLPALIEQIQRSVATVEQEIERRADKQGREVENEALALLFREDLELGTRQPSGRKSESLAHTFE